MTKEELIEGLNSIGNKEEVFISAVHELCPDEIPLLIEIDFVADQFINITLPKGW